MNLFNPFRRRKPPVPAHVHSWKPIAVNQGTLNGELDPIGQPMKATEILQVCGCSDYQRFIIRGHWSLEQVSAGELSKDVLELRRMASL
jgi:hypothetical protein